MQTDRFHRPTDAVDRPDNPALAIFVMRTLDGGSHTGILFRMRGTLVIRYSTFMPMGEADYRKGARDRIGEAYLLLREERFGGSVYLAGRGAEAALRAVLWMADLEIQQGKKSLDTGHDLRQLPTNVRNLGLLRAGGRDDPLITDVQHVARLWYNNMRFASARAIETRWYDLGEVTGRWTFKQASYDFYDACSAVVKRCEALCRNPKPKMP
jgi:hypothetical protein